MSGFTNLSKVEGLSREQVLDILMGAVMPGYTTEEGIQKYVRAQVSRQMSLKGVSEDELAERCELGVGEVTAIIKGRKPIDKTFMSRVQFALDTHVDELLPFNYQLPHGVYANIHKRITGRPPDSLPDPTGRLQLTILLASYAIPEERQPVLR